MVLRIQPKQALRGAVAAQNYATAPADTLKKQPVVVPMVDGNKKTETAEQKPVENTNADALVQENKDLQQQVEQDIAQAQADFEGAKETDDMKFGNTETGFADSKSAAGQLRNEVATDIELEDDSKNPMAGLYTSVKEARKKAIREGKDISDMDKQMDVIEETVRDMLDLSNERIAAINTDDAVEKVYSFGQNDEKKLIVEQSVRFGGNDAIRDRKSDVLSSGNEEDDDTDDGDENASVAPNSILNGGLVYNAKLKTNTGFEAAGSIYVETENSDIQVAASYEKKTDNGNYFVTAGSARVTIDGGETSSSAGIAMDYKNPENKISIGGYVRLRHETFKDRVTADNDDNDNNNNNETIDDNNDLALDDNNTEASNNNDNNTTVTIGNSTETKAEIYFNYDNKFRLAGGIDGSKELKQFYAITSGHLEKEFTDKNLKLVGAASAQYNMYKFNEKELGFPMSPMHEIEAKVRGGLYFNTDEISASVGGSVYYGCLIDPSAKTKEDRYDHSVAFSGITTFRHGYVDVSAVVTGYHDTSMNEVLGEGNSFKLATSFIIKFPNLLNGVEPSISYTIDNAAQGQRVHRVGLNLNLGLEELFAKRK